MVQTEDGKQITDALTEEGRLVVEHTLSENGLVVHGDATIFSSETGAGLEAESLVKLINVLYGAETGAGVEAISEQLAALLQAETGAGVEAISEQLAALLQAEIGVGVEAISEQLAALLQAETGVGVDAETLVKLINVLYGAATGTGVDTISEQLATVVGSEAPGYNGSDNLTGPGGVTITHNLNISNYQPEIEIKEESGAVGEIWVTGITVNSFVVRNSGIGEVEFLWTIYKGVVQADHRGNDNLAGPTGVTVTHNLGISNYRPDIGLTEESGAVGEIWITDITANSFVVRNSGIGAASFSWAIYAENVDANHGGTDDLAGPGGVTIQHDLDLAFYQLQVGLTEESGAVGEIWITDITANSFVVRNSGIGEVEFSWVIYGVVSGVDAITEQLATLLQAETGAGLEAESLVKLINVLYGAETGAGAEAELREELIGIEPPYTVKLGGVSLWVPELTKQNFTITYEENDIPRFSFTLQNCDVNRTAIINHLTDDFVIYRGATPILTGVIDCDKIEYVSINQIKVGGFSKWIELSYLIYKRMADADAESADAVFIRDFPLFWTDRTFAASNDWINDVTVTFNSVGDGIYIGDNDRFNSIKVKYSTKGIQTGTPTFNVQYSKGSGVWATLDCIDDSREFTNEAGTYFIFMPTLPPDWSKDTVNSSSKYWIRIILATGSYSTEPKLDRIWISQTDVCRVQFDNTAADTIMDLVLADTGYSVDETDQCPSTIIPSIRGEYDSKLRWVAGIINALKREDESGDAQPYAWWINASTKKVHIKTVRGSSYGDITAELVVLGNRLNYFEIANRIFGLGGGTGINQYHAIVENRSAQDTLGEIRETTYNDSRIFDHSLLNGQSGKLLTQSKTAKAQVKCSMPTYNWFEGGYEIGDRIKLHQPKWGIPDETEYAIRRVDISLNIVNFDVGIGREHLDNLQGNLQQQMNIQDVYMQGETSTFQVGPVEANYQRVDDTTVYPAKMVIEIPSNTKAINKAVISWKLGPYHADVISTETGGGHDHGGAAGAGGGHTPTELGKAHIHNLDGTLKIPHASAIRWFPVASAQYQSAVQNLTHHHSNPTTGNQNRGHAHGLPDYTGAYDDYDELVFNSLDTGTPCAEGYCITGGGGVNVPSTTHLHHLGGNTGGISQSHTHTQGNTGDANPAAYIDLIDHYVVTAISDYAISIPSQSDDPAHLHTINTVADHSNHGIDTLADFTLDMKYGMVEIPGGTVMELIVNGVTVGSYDGDATNVKIRGYLSNGNNNVCLQPIVTANEKGSAQMDGIIKIFTDVE